MLEQSWASFSDDQKREKLAFMGRLLELGLSGISGQDIAEGGKKLYPKRGSGTENVFYFIEVALDNQNEVSLQILANGVANFFLLGHQSHI